MLGLFDLFGQGGHFGPRAAVQDPGIVDPQSLQGTGHVHGGVATADDGHPGGHSAKQVAQHFHLPLGIVCLVRQVDRFQQLNARNHPLQVLAWKPQPMTLMCSYADKNRLVSLVEEVIQRILAFRADGRVELDLDAQTLNALYLALNDVAR